MSTNNADQVNPETTLGTPLNLREITALLIKHYDLHEGKYSLAIEFQIGTGLSGPNQENLAPSVMVGISKFGLASAKDDLEPTVVDAAEVNPLRKRNLKSKTG